MKEEIKGNWNKVFRDLLKEKGITRYRLAKDTGVEYGRMTRYLNGVKIPHDIFLKMCNYLEIKL